MYTSTPLNEKAEIFAAGRDRVRKLMEVNCVLKRGRKTEAPTPGEQGC